VRSLVKAGEGHRRGVVVDTSRVQLELLDDVNGQLEEQRPRPQADQRIQAAGYAIVVQRTFLYGGEFQCRRINGMGPLRNPVQWSGREDDVLDEDGKSPGVVENPLVRGAQARAHDTRELHAAEKRVEDRVRADEVYPVNGRALVCNHVLGMADLSGIHNRTSVYYTP